MTSIQEHLDKIKNAIFGKDVRQAIHDSIKQCYDDAAVNHDNANMEVKLARGSHNTLNDRLVENEKNQEKISSQLINIENEVEVNFEKLENNKSDIKIELLDTLMCNANFFKLTNNSSYPILQGGCLSDDGLNIKIV